MFIDFVLGNKDISSYTYPQQSNRVKSRMVLLSLSTCIFPSLRGRDGEGNLSHTEKYLIAFSNDGSSFFSGPGASILGDGLNVLVS